MLSSELGLNKSNNEFKSYQKLRWIKIIAKTVLPLVKLISNFAMRKRRRVARKYFWNLSCRRIVIINLEYFNWQEHCAPKYTKMFWYRECIFYHSDINIYNIWYLFQWYFFRYRKDINFLRVIYVKEIEYFYFW